MVVGINSSGISSRGGRFIGVSFGILSGGISSGIYIVVDGIYGVVSYSNIVVVVFNVFVVIGMHSQTPSLT